MSAIVGILSVLMGFVLGLLGGGGSILTVPILVYVAGEDPNGAIATSLLVVGVTSGVSAVSHARLGNVRFKIGLLFGVVAMAGAYAGGRAAALFSGTTLLILFAIMMLIAGGAMIRRKRAPASGKPEEDQERPFRPIRIGLEGFIVGALTGLVGAGGGFVVVPALVLLGGLGMRAAVGTSLMVISMKSFSGLAGHLAHATVAVELAAFVTALAVVGALVGARATAKVKPASLKRGFGVFVLIMAVVIIAKELIPSP